jgi:hypothetical protein
MLCWEQQYLLLLGCCKEAINRVKVIVICTWKQLHHHISVKLFTASGKNDVIFPSHRCSKTDTYCLSPHNLSKSNSRCNNKQVQLLPYRIQLKTLNCQKLYVCFHSSLSSQRIGSCDSESWKYSSVTFNFHSRSWNSPSQIFTGNMQQVTTFHALWACAGLRV